MHKDEMIGLEDAACRLGTTSLNTLMHIKRGLLKGVEIDGTWQVELCSLEDLLQKTGGHKAAGVCAAKHACRGCR